MSIVPFDTTDAFEFGQIRNNLEKRGLIIDPMGLFIAAQAKAKKLILVTNNVNEFQRVVGLTIENWVKPNSTNKK